MKVLGAILITLLVWSVAVILGIFLIKLVLDKLQTPQTVIWNRIAFLSFLIILAIWGILLITGSI